LLQCMIAVMPKERSKILVNRLRTCSKISKRNTKKNTSSY
jgi:hypothetical protein